LRDFFPIRDSIFDMQPDGILDVLNGLFVGIALAVAALECRARDEEPVSVAFDDNRKSDAFHDYDDYRSPASGGKTQFLQTCAPLFVAQRHDRIDPRRPLRWQPCP
jgi:hypothetical protein